MEFASQLPATPGFLHVVKWTSSICYKLTVQFAVVVCVCSNVLHCMRARAISNLAIDKLKLRRSGNNYSPQWAEKSLFRLYPFPLNYARIYPGNNWAHFYLHLKRVPRTKIVFFRESLFSRATSLFRAHNDNFRYGSNDGVPAVYMGCTPLHQPCLLLLLTFRALDWTSTKTKLQLLSSTQKAMCCSS